MTPRQPAGWHGANSRPDRGEIRQRATRVQSPRRKARGFLRSDGRKGDPTVVPFELVTVEGIRTRFVRDRLAETTFAQRASIADLIHWESVAAAGGPTGWVGHLFYKQFEQAQPVECGCIVEELRTGRYTPPEAYRALLTNHEGDRRQHAEAARLAALTRSEAERQAWLRARGRP